MLNELPCWTAIARIWRNQLASLRSPVASTRRWHTALKMTFKPYTPMVSTSIGSNMCLCKSCILTAFALRGVVGSCASVHRWPIQVYPSKSINTRVIPNQSPTSIKREDCYPSKTDSSPLHNLGGSRTDIRPAFWSALLITSFIAECLGKRPVATVFAGKLLCKPLLSIHHPQTQEWGIQTSDPIWCICTRRLINSSFSRNNRSSSNKRP